MNKKEYGTRWHPITWGIIVIGVIGLATAIVIPLVVKDLNRTCQPACINNLRAIDSGKEQWASANGKTNRDPVVVGEVNQYIKGNATPVCPNGGTYTYNAIGSNPTCTVTSPTVHRFVGH